MFSGIFGASDVVRAIFLKIKHFLYGKEDFMQLRIYQAGCDHPQLLHMPCLYVTCMSIGTDGAGRGKTFLLIFLRNYKLRCDYRTVKKELPQRNFQMVMQNN